MSPFRRCAWICLYGFRRCPFGTRLRSNLATPWALILMGFGCFGRWPTTASCNGVSFPSYSFFSSPSIPPPTIPEMCLDVFLRVSKVPFRHPSAVEFGHPLGSYPDGVWLFRQVAHDGLLQRCLLSKLYIFSSPSIRPPTIPEMCLDVFLRVSKVPFRHPSAVEFGHPLGSYPDGVWLFRQVAHDGLLQRCVLSKL